jgi:putative LysE/RhtB family amino acid efflux pump
LLAAAGSIFLLTLTNPMTILFFSAVFAGLSTGAPASLRTEAVGFATGIFFGSLVWWLILSGGVSYLRSRFRLQQLQWLNKASGLAIVGFGVWILVSLILM